MALLEVRDVTLRFGGIVALDGVSFEVDRIGVRSSTFHGEVASRLVV